MNFMDLISNGRALNVNYSLDIAKNIDFSFKGGIKMVEPNQLP